MAPDMELQGKLKSEALTEAITSNEDAIVRQDSVPKSMPRARNEDSEFDVKTALDLDVAVGRKMELCEEDMVVDITECSELGGTGQLDDETLEPDSTENSSSFGGTLSGAENGAPLSDGEVDSQDMVGPFCLNGYPDESQVRKKKLTDHWRRFIHPLRWRCQWLELQIKELQSRAAKYDKLAEYEHQKHLAFDEVTSEGCNSKSLAFSGQVQRNNILKRKRRKKVEQTVDLPSYISNHNLFSHYEKRSTADSVLARDQKTNQDDTRGYLDPGSDDKLNLGDGGTYMEQMLAKIYKLKSQVSNLRTRIEKVVSENPSSFNRLATVGIQSSAATTASDQNPPSPSANEHQSQHTGDLNAADASSQREAMASLPADVRESTSQTHDGNPITNNQETVNVKQEMLKHEDAEKHPPENHQEHTRIPEDQTAISPNKVKEEEEEEEGGGADCGLPIKETPVEAAAAAASNPRPPSHPPLKTYVKRRQRRREGPVVVPSCKTSKT